MLAYHLILSVFSFLVCYMITHTEKELLIEHGFKRSESEPRNLLSLLWFLVPIVNTCIIVYFVFALLFTKDEIEERAEKYMRS